MTPADDNPQPVVLDSQPGPTDSAPALQPVLIEIEPEQEAENPDVPAAPASNPEGAPAAQASSPEGAISCSQGREPLVEKADADPISPNASPEGAALDFGKLSRAADPAPSALALDENVNGASPPDIPAPDAPGDTAPPLSGLETQPEAQPDSQAAPPAVKLSLPDAPPPGQTHFEIVPDIAPEPEEIEADLAMPEPEIVVPDIAAASAQPDGSEIQITPPPSAPTSGAHGWTFVLLCLGIGLIACCLLIPQADENRRLLYECQKLKMDLEHVQKQIQTNEEFVKQITQDPTLAERLAQRQMNFIRKGTSVLDLPSQTTPEQERSPFVLTTVPPPPPLPAFRPVGGIWTSPFRDPKARLYIIGTGLMLMAIGLVLGHVSKD